MMDKRTDSGKGTEGAESAAGMALARLDELQEKWHPKAVGGDPVAAQIALDIHRQRAALLSLGRDAARLRQGTKAEAPAEIRIVVEYVDDWRKA